ncbi:MAG: hypothetical protein NC397_06495 [Clostridium sp.]|nr:hypothetical protein [Clostridium sp.]
MKKAFNIGICLILIASCLIGCSRDKETIIENTLTEFFSYYEKGDYEGMKKYCSEEFIENYFHDDDVFGNTTAKLLKITNIIYDEETAQYLVSIEMEITPTINSAHYDIENPIAATFIDIIITEQNNNMIIDGLTTG